MGNKPIRVDVACGKNRLAVLIQDVTDLYILKAWFENVLAKATKSISKEPAQESETKPPHP